MELLVTVSISAIDRLPYPWIPNECIQRYRTLLDTSYLKIIITAYLFQYL